MASTYLTRTPSSSGNRKTFTFSFWINRKGVGSSTFIYNQYNASDNDNNSALYIDGGDSLVFWDYTSPDYNMNLTTNRKFRDPSGWYHIVASVDTTQATASDRVKIYVNGVQETSFSTETYPSQNYDFILFDNSDRLKRYSYAFDFLEKAGFEEIPFFGKGPINGYEWKTSIYTKNKEILKLAWNTTDKTN